MGTAQPTYPPAPAISDSDTINRFLDNVSITEDCWEWKRSTNADEYGQMWLNGTMCRTHRISWLIFHGDIPDDRHVLHKCDNRRCCNPAHLYLGTHSENMRDAIESGNKPPVYGTEQSHGLNADEVREIRRLADQNWSYPEPAERFNVSAKTIGCVVRRETYTHID